MNAQIVKLFGVVLVLYGALVGFTSYWSVFDAEGLVENTANKRPLLEEQRIKRGRILAHDGTVIAKSVPEGRGAGRIFVRSYPQGELFGNPVGYNFVDRGRAGIELSHNDDLVGEKTEFLSILDELQGHEQEGLDLFTSLDPEAQRIAIEGLAGQAGSIVAIVPDTGEVRVMASFPQYDPSRVDTDFPALNADQTAPLLNRATQGLYPPGSTMKVVTAAAALDSGDYEPDTTVDGSSPQVISGVPLNNFDNASYGQIPLTEALTNSVNTVWASVAEDIGSDSLFKYMNRFGFNRQPLLDYPGFQLATSGSFTDGSLDGPGDGVDVGRTAIGQGRLLVTPLQMAEVAAAVANDGELMEPRLWSKMVDSDGRVTELDPDRQAQVISSETADELQSMMTDVVNEGTGTAAALSGIDVAGKTGTADIDGRPGCEVSDPNQAWFIGFAPADDPQIAIAATVECTSGQGGTVAAPIAASVMESLIE